MVQLADVANARKRVLIAEEREAVDRDRADLEAKLARNSAVQPTSEERFKLNVGGVRYDASRAALTKVPESMLAVMFGRRVDMLQSNPEDGSIFIDRNGEHFGLVLDFLRDCDASQVAKTIRELPTEPQREAVLHELNFYGLVDAVFPRRPWIDDAEFKSLGPNLNFVYGWCAAILHGRSVVVFGGNNKRGGEIALNTTEVIDLDGDGTTKMITEGPTMATARAGCGAVRLDARRVLVVGGTDLCYSPAGFLDTTEILDLETMRFSAGPRMLSQRSCCAVVALDAGRILVAGGHGENNAAQRTTEIFDVATMTFAPGPEMLSARRGCSAVALEGNPRRALIVGGNSSGVNLNTTEVLDLGTMIFSLGPTMRTARSGCVAVTLGGDSRGRCLVIGGADKKHSKVNTTEVLDLETLEFTGYGPEMLRERSGCAAVADFAGSGRVVVLGGFIQNVVLDAFFPTAEIEVLETAAPQLFGPLSRLWAFGKEVAIALRDNHEKALGRLLAPASGLIFRLQEQLERLFFPKMHALPT